MSRDLGVSIRFPLTCSLCAVEQHDGEPAQNLIQNAVSFAGDQARITYTAPPEPLLVVCLLRQSSTTLLHPYGARQPANLIRHRVG